MGLIDVKYNNYILFLLKFIVFVDFYVQYVICITDINKSLSI